MSKSDPIPCSRISYSVLLVFTLSVLLAHSVHDVAGTAFWSPTIQARTTISPPSVTLETGTAGITTIYANKTSAKASVIAENNTLDYVIGVNNAVASAWHVRLSKYSESSIGRLENCTIYFHNSTDGTLVQIQIENGAYTQQCGSWYNLPSSATIYVAVTAEANDTGTSLVCAYLEILAPGTTTCTRYVVTFEVT